MTSRANTGPDRTLSGIAIILVSVLAMAFADALVKLISDDLTVWQIFVIRSLLAAGFLVSFGRWTRARLWPAAAGWTAVRSVLLVLTWLAFYASLPVLSLSVAAVAVYTNPIITALLSAALTGERVTRRQWTGVVMGFCGVIAILRPGSDAFSWFVLLPLLAAVAYSCAMVLTRTKCQSEPPMALALNLHGCFILAGLAATGLILALDLSTATVATMPFLLGDWGSMALREWGLLILLGALSAAYFVGVARAYQIAPAPIIATFDYAYLVSAALWGFLFFLETPDIWTVAGMVLITLAGLLVAIQPSRPGPVPPRAA